jgi:hypothetical protein
MYPDLQVDEEMAVVNAQHLEELAALRAAHEQQLMSMQVNEAHDPPVMV